MTKYQPLRNFLDRQRGAEVPVRFEEIEHALGFKLPASARSYPAWWSNNEGSHVAVKVWRDAGWRTSRVDVGGERLVFVRDRAAAAPGVAEAPATFHPRSVAQWTVASVDLTPAARKMVEEEARVSDASLGAATAELLNELALQRRRRILDWFAANTTASSVTSAELIREDRDAR